MVLKIFKSPVEIEKARTIGAKDKKKRTRKQLWEDHMNRAMSAGDLMTASHYKDKLEKLAYKKKYGEKY
jgi:hypothetical protein